MIPFVEMVRQRGIWQVAVAYAAVALAVIGLVWGAVSVLELSVLYVHLAGVFAFMGLPMALGIAWALCEPRDPDGKGYVVRE